MQRFRSIKDSVLKWTKAQKTLAMVLVFIIAMGLAAVFSNKGFMNVYDFKEELNHLKKRNAALAEENESIRKEINALKSDPYAVEMLARDKLNLVKPGEKIYQIVRD